VRCFYGSAPGNRFLYRLGKSFDLLFVLGSREVALVLLTISFTVLFKSLRAALSLSVSRLFFVSGRCHHSIWTAIFLAKSSLSFHSEVGFVGFVDTHSRYIPPDARFFDARFLCSNCGSVLKTLRWSRLSFRVFEV
jgi:hypothetical protein